MSRTCQKPEPVPAMVCQPGFTLYAVAVEDSEHLYSNWNMFKFVRLYSKLMIHKNIEMADSLMIERLEGLPWHCLQAVIDNFNSSVLVCTFSNHQTNTIVTSHCLSIISAFTVALFPVRLPSRDLVVFKCQCQWPSSQSLVVNVNQCHWLTPGRYITDLRLRYNVSCWEMIADQMLKNALTQSD